MSENLDSKKLEAGYPKLNHVSLEQGRILVNRLKECLNQNSGADLYVLIDFGAEPLGVILKELKEDSYIEHLRITRGMANGYVKSEQSIQDYIGKTNSDFLQNVIGVKKYVVLIDDIEFEGKTLNFTEEIVRSFKSKCRIVKFPILKSTQNVSPGDNGWPFVLFDDFGMIKGYKMPWENQNKFFNRTVDPNISMHTVPTNNPDKLAISLGEDLQKITQYFKNNRL